MKRVFVSLIMVACISSAAVAQQDSGTMPGESGTRLGSRERNPAAEYGVRFARCLANYKRRQAVAWLATAPGTPASAATYEALVPHRDNRCVSIGSVTVGGASLNMTPRILRGHLAQALYLNRFSDGPPAMPDAAREIPADAYIARVTGAADRESEIIRVFGECMATRHAVAVDGLLRTDVETDEESAALAALTPEMGPCLWNGQSIAFSRESLRAALADGLYRMTIAAPAAGGGV